MDFLQDLDALHQTFWYIAIPVSVIFIIQMVMTFMGADASDGIEADFEGDFDGGDAPFQLFSLRNLINFLLGFGWSGVLLFERFDNVTVLVVMDFLFGAGFVGMFFCLVTSIR